MKRVDVWRDLPLDTKEKHTWAFYYFLKRCGDQVRIIRRTPTSIDIEVTRDDEELVMAANDSLINKYRPYELKEVVGQGAIIKSLTNVIDKRLSQAFLFTGPSGCGKTTLARIAARMFGCTSDLDIQEIDAATYTGIDAMRAVTAGLNYKPLGESKVKALIIDECHALSKSAWQALLKILEEPPSWAYWFLCTTEADRVLLTGKTRCVRYELKAVSKNDLFDLLDRVAASEKMKVDEGIIDLCAREAYGSARQALSNLAKCAGAETRAEAADLLASAEESSEAIDLARALIKNASWLTIADILNRLKDQNPESVRHVVKGYLTTAALGTKADKQAGLLIELLEPFAKPFTSTDGLAPLLVAVARAMRL